MDVDVHDHNESIIQNITTQHYTQRLQQLFNWQMNRKIINTLFSI